MVVILSESDDLPKGEAIVKNLQEAYPVQLEAVALTTKGDLRWPFIELSWDDLLIVLFSGSDFPNPVARFIFKFMEVWPSENILPVALNGNHPIPPKPIDGIKALAPDGEEDLFGRIVLRVGAMLGLKLRRRESTVFISYRAADGKKAAEQLYGHLKDNGFNPWLDEARDEFDNEGNISAGKDVQKVIEENLSRADLVLLIDTPKASDSRWIRLEIENAHSHLLPILPVCCKVKADGYRGLLVCLSPSSPSLDNIEDEPEQ